MLSALKNNLADYGYSLVALPKSNIKPLMLLYKNENAVNSVNAGLQELFPVTNVALPNITQDPEISNISTSANVTYEAETGVGVLDNLLKKLNLGNLKAGAKINGSYKVELSYLNLVEEKVNLLKLDEYISGSDPNVDKFKFLKEKLMDSELYIVSSTLSTNSFFIKISDENGQSANTDITVKGIVNAKGNFNRKEGDGLYFQNENAERVVFAFQAQRIIYGKKKWYEFFKVEEAGFKIKNQQGLVLRSEEDFPTDPLQMGNYTVSI